MTTNKYNGALTTSEQYMFYSEQIRILQEEKYFAGAASEMWKAQRCERWLYVDAMVVYNKDNIT